MVAAPARSMRPSGWSREAALVGRVHRAVVGPGPTTEPGALVVEERLAQPGLVVHHERALLGDRLADRSALEDQCLGAAAPTRR